MLLTDFQIGDRCLFSFSSDRNIRVELVDVFRKNVFWLMPEEPSYKCGYAAHTKTINGRYVFAAHIDHLVFLDRPICEDAVNIDISTIL